MSGKTAAGFKLFGGLVLTVVGGQTAAWANGVTGRPSLDWYYDLWAWAGTIAAFGGMALFFFGAKGFAAERKK
jgi:hypothetical protein